jgi:hypothetical protein
MRTTGEITVRHMRPGSFGRLIQDISELGLRHGEVGVVRGVLSGLTQAYEVEFHRPGAGSPMRALLLANQLEPETGPLLCEPR